MCPTFNEPRGLLHARLLCPLLSFRVWIWIFSNSCPLSQWCHLTISSSVSPFSFCLQSFTVSGSFPMSQLYIRWPKYWSFSFNISLSNEYSGLISLRIDWFDFLAIQGTLKSLFQHHSLKASILWGSAFFMVQLSHPYMTTGKTTALTIGTFVSKVMSLLFNTLSRFIIAFILEQVCFNFVPAVTTHSGFGAQESKISHYFHFFPIYLPWSDGIGCHDLSFLNVEF